MEKSPAGEANRFPASQEIPCLIWNLKVHYRIHSARHLSLSSASSIQSIPPTSYFLKIHLNIILPSTPRSPKWSISLRFPHQNPVYASPLPPYALIFLSHTNWSSYSWFQTFALFWMLYAFFCVIPRCLNFHILCTGDSFAVLEAM